MRWLKTRARISTAEVAALVEQGLIKPGGLQRALQLAGNVPTATGWREAIERLLLIAGIVMMLSGIGCVVAYNWSGLGRWGKFGLAQLVLIGVLAGVLWRGPAHPYGKLLLTVAIVLIGPLLALFGQTYQTGADSFELFRGWALLALPWVAASCYAPAWLFWLVLIEVACAFYVDAFDLWQVLWWGIAPMWLFGCLFNIAVLIVWEFAAARFDWLSGRLGPRLIATCLLGFLTVLTCMAILGDQFLSSMPMPRLGPLLWALVMAAGYLAYRVKAVDLGMLALGWLSLTAVLLTWLVRLVILVNAEAIGFLLGAALLIGASAWGRNWLASVAAEERP